MCGIWAYLKTKGDEISEEEAGFCQETFRNLVARGSDAHGYFTFPNNHLYRSPTSIEDNLKKNPDRFIEKFAGQQIAAGHTRAYTVGAPVNILNNHPFRTKDLVLSHNGVIRNYEQVISELGLKKYMNGKKIETDSFAIIGAIQHFIDEGMETKEAIIATSKKLRGGMCCWLWSKPEETMYLFRNDYPNYSAELTYLRDFNSIILSSGKKFHDCALSISKMDIGFFTSANALRKELPENTILRFGIDGNKFKIDEWNDVIKEAKFSSTYSSGYIYGRRYSNWNQSSCGFYSYDGTSQENLKEEQISQAFISILEEKFPRLFEVKLVTENKILLELIFTLLRNEKGTYRMYGFNFGKGGNIKLKPRLSILSSFLAVTGKLFSGIDPTMFQYYEELEHWKRKIVGRATLIKNEKLLNACSKEIIVREKKIPINGKTLDSYSKELGLKLKELKSSWICDLIEEIYPGPKHIHVKLADTLAGRLVTDELIKRGFHRSPSDETEVMVPTVEVNIFPDIISFLDYSLRMK